MRVPRPLEIASEISEKKHIIVCGLLKSQQNQGYHDFVCALRFDYCAWLVRILCMPLYFSIVSA